MSGIDDKISRRAMLQRSSLGFGAVAIDALFGRRRPPRRARARNVIFCYMSGGVSHVDSFDPKPKLRELHGQSMPVAVERTQFNNNGKVMVITKDRGIALSVARKANERISKSR